MNLMILEQAQERVSGAAALADVIANATGYASDDQLSDALFAFKKYLNDAADLIADVIKEAKGERQNG